MLFGVLHFGVENTWPELVLNVFYIACLVMMWMYFFNYRITTDQFNYWCSVCVGITVLLRDILFAPPLPFYSLRLACLTLLAYLHHRYPDCHALQHRHFPGARRRNQHLYDGGNLDPAHHHVRPRGLLCEGKESVNIKGLTAQVYRGPIFAGPGFFVSLCID